MNGAIRPGPHDRITVLTGAGISAESGVMTFRDANGLWENHRFEDVASPEAFARDSRTVWRFYKMRYANVLSSRPNPAHHALVRLENFSRKTFTLITQNVDGLHTLAGNRNVIEMHGSIHRCYCMKCNQLYRTEKIRLDQDVPICPACNSRLRPDIVWFGETPYGLELINDTLRNTDIFIVIGTSGVVYPAAQFLEFARLFNARTIGINLETPANVLFFDEFYKGKAGEILPELVQSWLAD